MDGVVRYDREAIARILAETDEHLMGIGKGPRRSLPRELHGSFYASPGAFSEVPRPGIEPGWVGLKCCRYIAALTLDECRSRRSRIVGQ